MQTATPEPQTAFEETPDIVPPATNSKRGGVLVPLAIILAAICFAFYPSLGNEFLRWDDHTNIVDNPLINPPSWEGLIRLWSQPYLRLYAPLFYTSLLPDILAGKGNVLPAFVHAGNILIHAASAVVLFFLLRLLLDTRSSRRVIPVLIGTLVFAVHPLQTEPVAWATGRKDLLAGFLSLLALYFYARFRTSESGGELPSSSGRRKLLYGLSFLCFLLSLFAKPSTVTIPLVALVFDLCLFRKRFRQSMVPVLPMLVLSAAWVLLTSHAQQIPDRLAKVLPSITSRPFIASDAILFYIGKIVFPMDLSPDYGRIPWRALQNPLYPWSLLICIVGGLLLLWRKNALAAGSALFLLGVLPVLGLVPFDNQLNSTVADRYAYVSMAGVGLVVGYLLTQLAETRHLYLTLSVVFLTVCCGYVALANQQARVWRNDRTLWLHAISAEPSSSVAHTNLGMVYATEKALDKAEQEYLRAIESDPNNANARNNLGNIYGEAQRFDEAMEQYKLAVESDPDQILAHTNLASIYFQRQDAEGAIRHAREALRVQPGFPQAVMVLASTLFNTGRADEATSVTREALALNPADALLKSVLSDLEKNTNIQ